MGPGSLILGKRVAQTERLLCHMKQTNKNKKGLLLGIRGVEGSIGVETTCKLNTGLGI